MIPPSQQFHGSEPATKFYTNAQYVAFKQGPKALLIRVVAPSVGQHEAPIIASEVHDVLENVPKRCQWVVLDLSGVSVLSSMGLGLCLDIRKRARKSGMKTILFGLNSHLRGLFQMMKVERLYKVVHSKDDLKKLIDG